MSEFKPRPLASYAKTTRLGDLETNLFLATQLVGGSCYSAGVAYGPVVGAIGKDNLKPAAWITNDRKTEPYSALAFQGYVADLTGVGTRTICIPGIGHIPDAVGIQIGFSYAYCSGANFSGTLIAKICGTTCPTMTITNLVPGALATVSIAATSWTPSTNASFAEVALTNSSGGTMIADGVVTIAIKSKHIA